MSRENFLVKLTGLNNEPEFVMVHNIFRMREVKETDKKPKHTLVSSVEGFSIEVSEPVAEIERKATSFGVLKVM